MIGQTLLAALHRAREIALHQPEHLAAALDTIADRVNRLLDLTGEAAAPLRQVGQRMVAALQQAQDCAGDRMEILAELTEEALLACRLELVLPCRDTRSPVFPPARIQQATVPRHWLPQLAAQAEQRRPFTVVRGGRA